MFWHIWSKPGSSAESCWLWPQGRWRPLPDQGSHRGRRWRGRALGALRSSPSASGSPGPSLAPICSEWLHHGTSPGLWGQMAHAPPHSSVAGGLWPSLGSHCPCLTQQGPSRVRRTPPPKLACSSPSPHRNHPFGLNFREGLG